MQEAIEIRPWWWKRIAGLVNNAGLAVGRDPITTALTEDWDKTIETNLKGLLYMKRAVLPLMLEQKHGHIVNIGSLAGKEMYPNGNVYAATKHAVVALSKGMRLDLIGQNIRVTVVNPGHVQTDFAKTRYKGNLEKVKELYDGFRTLDPEDIAEAIWFAVSRPAHVNVDDILITPTDRRSTSIHRVNSYAVILIL